VVATVIEENEVSINGVYYPTNRPVQAVLASLYPPKVTIGDTSRDSQTRASVISWADWRGGLGTERMEGAVDVDKTWWSTAQLRYKRHLVLPPLANKTGANGTLASTAHAVAGLTTAVIGEISDTIYATCDNKVLKYVSATDVWSVVATLGANATDTLTVNLGGTIYIIFAHTTGYTYSDPSDLTSWTADTTHTAKYMAWWNNKLYWINNDGQLYNATAPNASPSTDALLPLPAGQVTDLFTARDSSGNSILYASTKVGLFAHDSANTKWVETEVDFPFHPFNGMGTRRWRDSVYFPAGLGIYKYINGSNNAVITTVGPDKDDGLPSEARGTIKRLDASHNELLAMVDATTSPTVPSDAVTGNFQWSAVQHGHGSPVMPTDTGTSGIYGYNEIGWQTKWYAPDAGKPILDTHVSNAHDGYRLWWVFDNDVYNMKIASDIINPSQLADFEYAKSAEHYTPWFDAGQVEVDKLALRLKVEASDLSANEKLTIYYEIDHAEEPIAIQIGDTDVTSTTMGAVKGVQTFNFGDSTSVLNGTAFRAIRFKITLEREDSDTDAAKKLSPDLISLTFEYRKKLESKWGHTVTVDFSDDYKGNTPMELRSNLVTAIESRQLVEFTFRDDSGGTRNYYVDIASASGLEYTGYDERGQSQILLVEP
jgi:hypothetical protein|tara:strand:+ start:853 stop:2817 length:1965 start_codon:yes stop_codon:yes gene_type:complete